MSPTSPAAPVDPARGVVRPLGVDQVTISGGFWAGRRRVNASATLAHCEAWMERLGWLANFDRVADGTIGDDRPGWPFSDSEVYKLLEALCWAAGRTGDPAAEAAISRLTARIARAQDPDGYLNTCYGHGTRPARYTALESGHELYNLGHLLQAAVARVRTTGPDDLVEVARRAADHVCDTFGPGGREAICGHPEIEVGLAELGRALGEPRYLDQAELFLDRRGHGLLPDIPLGRAYFQDDMPIRDADVWRGHAVRALYLAAAAVDVAVDRGDDELLAAVRRQWERSVARRTYLTGGMGSRHQDEGFGADWELPPDRAYCETCAGVASVMVSWRLFLATGDVRYTDLIERTLYNVVAASPSTEGTAFFYANPLHHRTAAGPLDIGPDEVSPRADAGVRAPWFEVSCCPTNVARTLAGLTAYLATTDDDGLQIHQFATGRITAELPGGRPVGVRMTTGYPADGRIRIRVTSPEPAEWTLSLRVPSWAAGATLTDGGRTRPVGPGTARIRRVFRRDDEIVLDLPVGPRFTWPDPRIDAVRGCVAVERGPEVLCVESRDLPDPDRLDALVIDPAAGVSEVARGRFAAGVGQGWPYAPAPAPADPSDWFDVPLLPYHSWARRGPSAMRVWLPVAG
jgi:DUF1680 family protein